MEKIKHTLTTRWKLLVVILLLVPGVLTLLWLYPPISTDGKVDSTSVAAWVQGVGTVLAVLAAAWIARDQFDWQQRAEARRRAAEQFVELDVIRDALAELARVTRHAQDAASAPDVFRAFYGGEGSFDELAFDALLHFCAGAPLSASHGPALHIQRRKINYAAGGVARLAAVFQKMADAIPPRHHMDASHLADLAAHREALDEALAAFESAIRALPRD
ncbi:hypothetical protein [Roseateles sp. P5_D6]